MNISPVFILHKTGKIFIPPSVLLGFTWNWYHWIQNFISFKWKLRLHNHSIINIVPNRKKKTQYFAPQVAFPRDLRNKNSTVGFSSFLRIQRYIICHEIKCLKFWHPLFYQIMCQEQCPAFHFLHIWILLIFLIFLVYHTWW